MQIRGLRKRLRVIMLKIWKNCVKSLKIGCNTCRNLSKLFILKGDKASGGLPRRT